MTIAAIVQARMSSTRFPGKMLHCVHGRPLLEYVLDRVRRSREIDQAIVATSAEASDDPIADYCRQHGVDYFRGSLKDVASRFGEVSDAHRLEAFVRVCGDRPLLDPALLDRGVQMFRKTESDLVTNCFPRTFPAGQTVEVVRVSTVSSASQNMTTSISSMASMAWNRSIRECCNALSSNARSCTSRTGLFARCGGM